MKKQKIVLLGLNELNFDYIKFYAEKGQLPAFKKIITNYNIVETTSESEYKLLEPWIQWVTITTGKKYEEHKVFRLGDIVERKDLNQIFEEIENKGYTVGAVSPFNADNRLKNPEFFVPDPWTQTQPSGSKNLKALSNTISNLVNDNAKSKITLKSISILILSLLKYVPPKKYFEYIKLVSSVKSKVGVKAIFLDKFLADVFVYLWKRKRPDFSNLFLNTGAHIQHHYLFNSLAYKGDLKNPEWYCPSNQDPLLLVLKTYDKIIMELDKLKIRLIICTGLHQEPHHKETYYWRLKEHERFLKGINIEGIKNVVPRMSRDFLIEFKSPEDATKAQKKLESCISNTEKSPLFSIDNRGESLFVELIYSRKIDSDFKFEINEKIIEGFKKDIAFVAIKNGQHNGIGYYIDTGKQELQNKQIPLTDTNKLIKEAVFNA